jgi:hypothetical protein
MKFIIMQLLAISCCFLPLRSRGREMSKCGCQCVCWSEFLSSFLRKFLPSVSSFPHMYFTHIGTSQKEIRHWALRKQYANSTFGDEPQKPKDKNYYVNKKFSLGFRWDQHPSVVIQFIAFWDIKIRQWDCASRWLKLYYSCYENVSQFL